MYLLCVKGIVIPNNFLDASVTFKTKLKSDFTRMLLANSITLTPGTITVSLKGDEYTIHCLDESLSEGLENSDFEKALMKLDEEV